MLYSNYRGLRSVITGLLIYAAYAAPTKDRTILHIPDSATYGLLWASTALAVFTGLIQGLVTTMTIVAEDASMWTFRFRIARVEYLWWTLVSNLLLISLVMTTVSFMAGNHSDPISILVLTTATGVTIVRYAVPAWRNRHFTEQRWLAWTGPSRTTIQAGKGRFCGEEKRWRTLYNMAAKDGTGPDSGLALSPSDEYGPSLRPGRLLAADATAILNSIQTAAVAADLTVPTDELVGLYNDGLSQQLNTVSLHWGTKQGFRRRVSRAVGSMPLNLLRSQPVTVDNYVGRGLCLSMGVLGRNKGLQPKTLVYQSSPEVLTALEQTSTWCPRPSKVLRGYYQNTMNLQYSTISPAFVVAAVELALVLADASDRVIRTWFELGLEQQVCTLNCTINKHGATNDELNALYRANYVSMVISLNYFNLPGIQGIGSGGQLNHLHRPDLHAMALLMMAEGKPEPQWWKEKFVGQRLSEEESALHGSWHDPMAMMLGLSKWPEAMSEWGLGRKPIINTGKLGEN